MILCRLLGTAVNGSLNPHLLRHRSLDGKLDVSKVLSALGILLPPEFISKDPAFPVLGRPVPTTLHLSDIEVRSLERSEVRHLRSDTNCDLAYVSLPL